MGNEGGDDSKQYTRYPCMHTYIHTHAHTHTDRVFSGVRDVPPTPKKNFFQKVTYI